MHTYVQYVYVFVYIVHTYKARVGERAVAASCSCFSAQLITLQIVYNFPIIVHLILFECICSRNQKRVLAKTNKANFS